MSAEIGSPIAQAAPAQGLRSPHRASDSGPAGCEHLTWGHPAPGTPLLCLDCGALWPGEELPEAAHRLGPQHDPDKPSWASRVRAMVAEEV